MSITPIKIANVSIAAGEEKQINATISKLPSRTDITIPVIVSRSLIEGPTLLLMGGMHGDEINGIEIVRRIVAMGYNKPNRGTTICIPILNIYGFIHYTREVPDGKDINRSFPGSNKGSLASQIAYHLRKEIVPLIDCGIDFHTGGAKINNYPQIRADIDKSSNLDLAKAFSTRFVLNANLREKSFRKEAQKYGKPILVYEGGESVRLRKHAIDEGVNGARRVMKFLGMTDDAPEQSFETTYIEKSAWIRASAAGIFHSIPRNGTLVEKGMTVGLITGPFGDFEVKVKSRFSGHIIAINSNPIVNRGDALMHIGLIP